MGGNRWLPGRRPYLVARLYADFRDVLVTFRGLYQEFVSGRPLAYATVAALVGDDLHPGDLWRLKDLCHLLWRPQPPAEPSPAGMALDWTVGSLFHEAMKLKENLYLVEHYPPPAAGPGKAPPWSHEHGRVLARARQEVGRQMDTIGFLFGQGCYALYHLLPEQTDNRLLLRLLAEDEELADELWQEPVATIFAELFPGRPEAGYCLAGAGLGESGWFARGAKAYQRALELNPHCDEARHHLVRLQALAATVAG